MLVGVVLVVFLGVIYNFLFVGINRYYRIDGVIRVNCGLVWGVEEICDG